MLEGVARGGWAEVFGSVTALKNMLDQIGDKDCKRVIITFPNPEASNGLRSSKIIVFAEQC